MISMIVSTYNWHLALSLVLESIYNQTVQPKEIIIADDGSDYRTSQMIQKHIQKSDIVIRHVWHEDNGFRKCIILNKAIALAKEDYIIQIDGDIILNRHFVEDHLKEARPGYFLRGGRALLPENLTKKVFSEQNFNLAKSFWEIRNKLNGFRSPALATLLCRDSEDIRHVKGCNISYWKNDFIKVNGYNNDLMGWGHEDIEFAARLYNSGVRMKLIDRKSVV